MTDVTFQLKGTSLTVVVLELSQYNPADFLEQLQGKIAQAPEFFNQSPVLIDLQKLKESEKAPDLELLLEHCRLSGLQPVAFRGAKERFSEIVKNTGFALLPDSQSRTATRDLTPPNPEKEVQPEPEVIIETVIKEIPTRNPAKVVTKPVRSGQQVYAEDADLIVIGNVGEGAEVLADGSIHVYGALRGRALAGVRGDQQARIFCQQMKAELISVAGNFLPSDAVDEKMHQRAVQVFLEGESLKVELLG